MGEWAADLIRLGCEVWNTLVDYSIGIMAMTPESFNSDVWNTIIMLNNVLFIPVASALIVLFFAIGFCSEVTDVHSEMRLETALKYFIKLGFTETLVVFNADIIKAIFAVFGKLYKAVVSLAGGINGDTVFDPSEICDYLSGLGMIPAIGYILLNLIFLSVMAVMGVTMFYTVYTRLIKTLIMIPLGSFAMATVAGGRNIAMSAGAFIKYMASVAGEIIIILFALIIMKSVGANGLGLKSVFGISGEMDVKNIFFTELETMITALLTIGIVKGAQSMLQKALAL